MTSKQHEATLSLERCGEGLREAGSEPRMFAISNHHLTSLLHRRGRQISTNTFLLKLFEHAKGMRGTSTDTIQTVAVMVGEFKKQGLNI